MPRLKLAFIFSGQSSQEVAIVLLCLSGIGFPSAGRDGGVLQWQMLLIIGFIQNMKTLRNRKL